MQIDRISTHDCVGKLLIEIPNHKINLIQQFNNYYEIVKKLNPLRYQVDEKLTGFYINRIGVPYGGPHEHITVRLIYFTTNGDDTRTKIIEFLKSNNFRLLDRYEEKPKKETLSNSYGGDELRFRKFLFLSTLIGLDFVEQDIFLYTFVLQNQQNMLNIKSFRTIFEPIFIQHSSTFRQLPLNLVEQLWRDFELSGYAHMFKNMMLLG